MEKENQVLKEMIKDLIDIEEYSKAIASLKLHYDNNFFDHLSKEETLKKFILQFCDYIYIHNFKDIFELEDSKSIVPIILNMYKSDFEELPFTEHKIKSAELFSNYYEKYLVSDDHEEYSNTSKSTSLIKILGSRVNVSSFLNGVSNSVAEYLIDLAFKGMEEIVSDSFNLAIDYLTNEKASSEEIILSLFSTYSLIERVLIAPVTKLIYGQMYFIEIAYESFQFDKPIGTKDNIEKVISWLSSIEGIFALVDIESIFFEGHTDDYEEIKQTEYLYVLDSLHIQKSDPVLIDRCSTEWQIYIVKRYYREMMCVIIEAREHLKYINSRGIDYNKCYLSIFIDIYKLLSEGNVQIEEKLDLEANIIKEMAKKWKFEKAYNKDSYEINAYKGLDRSVVIPNRIGNKKVTELGWYSFRSHFQLVSIEMPEGISEIGGYAFENCINLEKVIIPNSLNIILPGAFAGCTKLLNFKNSIKTDNILKSSYSIIDGVIYNSEGDKTIRYPVGRIGEFIVPEKVKYIGEYSFQNCDGLTSILLPKDIVTIDNYAFFSCRKLRVVSIPESVKSIGDGAFIECTSLTTIYLPESIINIGEDAFNSSIIIKAKSGTYAIKYAKENGLRYLEM